MVQVQGELLYSWNVNINPLSSLYFQESSVSEVKSAASGGVKYATLGGNSDAQRKKDAKRLEKEAR